MTLARLVAALLRRSLTEPVATLRSVWWWLRDDPAYALVKADSLVSAGVRRRAYPPLLAGLRALRRSWPGGVLAAAEAFLLDALGRDGDATELICSRAAVARHAERLALAGFAAESGRARAALDLLAPEPVTPRVLRLRGRARWRAGDLTAAVADLEAAAARDRSVVSRRVAHRVADDLRALQPGWLPRVGVDPRASTGVHPRQAGKRATARVVHLLNNALPQVQTGYTVRAHRIAQAQRQAGCDPVMVTKLGFPWQQGYLTAPAVDHVDGVAYHHVPDPGGERGLGLATRIERGVAALLPVLQQLQPQLLHPTSPHDNAQIALALGRALGLPVVYELRGFLEDTWLSRQADGGENTDRYRLTRDVEGWCAGQADHVITLGEAMRADVVARGVAPERVTVVPNAVDVDSFQVAGRGAFLRRRLRIGDSEVVLGYVSSLVGYEGVDTLVRALRLLLDRGRPVRLLVVGDGPERTSLEALAAELGVSDRATFTGRVPHEQVHGYYEAIDIFVVPRRDDRVCRNVTPLKPLEAMAMQRPVVASRLPALVETIEEGVTGLSFVPEDAHDLARVVAPLVHDPPSRARLGAAAREWVAAERTWAANAARYRAIYAALGVEVTA